MPELPEVETVCRTIEPFVVGKTIEDINVYRPKCIKNTELENFISTLKGEKFLKITRKGKHIIFHLTNNNVLVSHLRMEGRYYFQSSETKVPKHIMAEFALSDGNSLRYIDTRQFGTFHLYKENNYLTSQQLAKLGLEPWDKGLTPKVLKQIIEKSNRTIKGILLDQGIITGIGNIYADEILFAAKINPATKAKEITLKECSKLIKETQNILGKSIEMKGSTINTYESTHGVTGRYQTMLKVHTKAGRNCVNCKSIILKTRVAGRGTYYCPKCQKIKD